MNLLVNGITQIELGVTWTLCLVVSRYARIAWRSRTDSNRRGVDDVVDPWKGDTHTTCLNLQQHNRWTLDEGEDVAHRTRREATYAEFRACLVNVLGDAELQETEFPCLNGPAISYLVLPLRIL